MCVCDDRQGECVCAVMKGCMCVCNRQGECVYAVMVCVCAVVEKVCVCDDRQGECVYAVMKGFV